MAEEQLQLLENALDSLDRLYDGVSSVVDVHALLFATCEAISESEFSEIAKPAIAELLMIIRSGESAERQQEMALAATGKLRLYLAKVL